ncbi:MULTISPECIES: right-handed parallel beta-helix repeat-containing protein [unclassified Bradyrhizobium]|uniref:right-handed parallel beta-helix repeat-containing protein n=1 Tax=unclassified Bradyrhizobium TaxID=2631580 RepID=UPI002916F27F|nr:MULTISPECIES: right-handed parallel beta-helix repeat-containing protein [unclassified Bradyrhizobium]
MSKLRGLFPIMCLAIMALLPTGASAQATRTWVSGVGDDANPCSRTAPCKTFAGAISKTAAGGEIDVLDPGGFGSVTITKSITIDGGGTEASVLASGTNGINVNAGATDLVILRNLSINGAGTTLGLNGINFLGGQKLAVENCSIENFSQSGIAVAPANVNAQVLISHSSLKANATGITFSTVNATGTLSGTISNVLVTHSSTSGISATVPAGKPSIGLIVNNTTSVFSGVGLSASGTGASVVISGSAFEGNTTGVSQTSGGAVYSFKNNSITFNATDGTPLTGIPLN